MERELIHFLNLAYNGRAVGASTGAKQARRLAIAISELAPGLDQIAIDGAVEFLRRAPLAPQTARLLINSPPPAGGGQP